LGETDLTQRAMSRALSLVYRLNYGVEQENLIRLGEVVIRERKNAAYRRQPHLPKYRH